VTTFRNRNYSSRGPGQFGSSRSRLILALLDDGAGKPLSKPVRTAIQIAPPFSPPNAGSNWFRVVVEAG
jgi:hypothetical protein